MNTNIKLSVYSSIWEFKKNIELENLKNPYELSFTESLNGWQGSFDINIWTNYDSTEYTEWDIIEYSIFNENNKWWLHRYTGYIHGINRFYNQDGEGIVLEVEGIVSKLSDYEITKTYTWTLASVIDEYITDYHLQYNITHSMPLLWSQFIKNGISNTDNISIDVNSDFLYNLWKIMWDRKFYVDHTWYIRLASENTNKHYITLNRDVWYFSINKDNEIQLTLQDSEIQIYPWDTIQLQNVPSFLNLSDEVVEQVDFSILDTTIYTGQVMNFGKEVQDN